MAFLELKNVEAFYGKIRALKGINLHVESGEIVTLIGANGAGKSTTLKSISGLMKLGRDSKIEFDGKDITNMAPHEIAKLGISHVPEGRGIFHENSVLENLKMGAYLNKNRSRVEELLDNALELFPRLRERLNQRAGTLSGGEQQMLTMARGMMMDPKLMLLDEPSMGLAPIIVEEVFKIIENFHNRGITILLVEQNAYLALQIAQRGYVIQTGNIALEDSSENLQNNRTVRGMYLGEAV